MNIYLLRDPNHILEYIPPPPVIYTKPLILKKSVAN